MSVEVSEGQIGIFNNTQYTISVRVTADNDPKGNTGFFDIEPGNQEVWVRSNWQVAFVLRRSAEPSDNQAKTLVVKPSAVYSINDN